MPLTRLCGGRSAALGLTLVLLGASAAAAHEHLVAGDYRLTIGWADEPAFVGFKNAVSVVITDKAESPVVDASTSVMVEVSFGEQRISLPLEPVRQRPGEFRAWLLPTRPGTYAFRIVGTVKGQHIDATSTCSERTFHCVADLASIQFPAKDPSLGDLAERVSRTLPRAERAGESATSARVFAILAAIAAAAALISSLVALNHSRQTGR
jgi:hypothetical protein